MSSIRRFAPVLFLLACGRQPSPDTEAPPPDIRNAEITVVVKNQHWLDLNVYIIRGTLSERLGTARGPADQVFSVPWSRVGGSGHIRLRADPVGQGGNLVTDFFTVRPGAVVEWTIGSGLRQSGISVF